MKPKKVKKAIESLEKQKEKHVEKIKDYDGQKSFLIEYWEKEIKRIEGDIEEKWKKLIKKK